MKKLLLCLFALASGSGLWAQSKTTGTVALTTGMTAKMDLNGATNTVTLTFTGPSDRWFALQFGSFSSNQGMASGQDLVYATNTGLVDAVMNGSGNTPSADTNNWTVTSNTVTGTTRTIVATRAFTGGTGDFNFTYSMTDVDFAWARGSAPGYSLAYHGGNRGYQMNRTFTCIAPDAPTASAQSFCTGATVASLQATGAAGAEFNWYNVPSGGTELAAGTALTTGNYYVSQTVDACESTRATVAVTVNSANAQVLMDVTACNSYTLPALQPNNNYYTGPGATGTMLTAGNVISATQLLYIYAQSGTVPNCTDESSFTVTINTLAAPTATANQVFCAGATVADLEVTGGAGASFIWYPAATGGTPFADTTVLSTGTYFVAQAVTGCESTARAQVNVTINAIPAAPTGAATQEFEAGDTIANLAVTTEDGATVTWYIMDAGMELTAVGTDTTLQDGGQYYVTQTLNNCESEPLMITAVDNLSVQGVSAKAFVIYPNPAADVLNISGKTAISKVVVSNMLGQELLNVTAGAKAVTVDVSALQSGNYLIRVYSGDAVSSYKIIKR
jgi:hypothetical protein